MWLASLVQCVAFAVVPPQAASPGAAPALPRAIHTRQTLFAIPFRIDRPDRITQEPTEVQLYVSGDRGGHWDYYSKVEPIRQQFMFRAGVDGEYWFNIRTLDKSGQTRPAGPAAPGLRVIVDTAPPKLRFDAVRGDAGQVTARVRIEEPYLKPGGLVIRYRTDVNAVWQTVPIGPRDIQAAGSLHTGEVILWPPAGAKTMELRAEVSDEAGNPAVSNTQVALNDNRATTTPSAAKPGQDVGRPPLTTPPTPGPATDPRPSATSPGPVPIGSTAAQEPWRPSSSESTTTRWPAEKPPTNGRTLVSLSIDGQKVEDTQPGSVAIRINPTRGNPSGPSTEKSSDTTSAFGQRRPDDSPIAHVPSPEPSPTAFGGEKVQTAPLVPVVRDREPAPPIGDNPMRSAAKPVDPFANAAPPIQEPSRPADNGVAATPKPVGAFDNNVPSNQRSASTVDNGVPSNQKPADAPDRSLAATPKPIDSADSAVLPNSKPAPVATAVVPAAQRINMINVKTFELEYSAVSADPVKIGQVELWCTRDGGQTWGRFGAGNGNGKPMLVKVEEEGVYGFRVVVQDRMGRYGKLPQRGDPPEISVGVDVTKPAARITSAQPNRGPNGNQIVISWEAFDNQKLIARPISLAFSETRSGVSTPIATNLENTGRYVWNLEGRLPPRAFLRLEVRDEAGNVAVDETAQSVPLIRSVASSTAHR